MINYKLVILILLLVEPIIQVFKCFSLRLVFVTKSAGKRRVPLIKELLVANCYFRTLIDRIQHVNRYVQGFKPSRFLAMITPDNTFTYSFLRNVTSFWGTILLVAFCFLPFPAHLQEQITIDGKPCGIHGNAKKDDAYALNAFKNRYNPPAISDFDSTITLAALMKSGDPNQYSQNKAAVLRGYVFDVKMGGVETCNCKTKDPQYRDTHIELVPDEAHTGAAYRVIAEVTPRLRTIMKGKGEDWSTAALRRTIKGQWVELAGWLTYDVEHESAAYANDPDDVIGQHNWRATVWEVHPITYLKVVKKGSGNPLVTIVKEQGGIHEKNVPIEASKGSGRPAWLVPLIVVLLVLVIAYFILKKKLG